MPRDAATVLLRPGPAPLPPPSIACRSRPLRCRAPRPSRRVGAFVSAGILLAFVALLRAPFASANDETGKDETANDRTGIDVSTFAEIERLVRALDSPSWQERVAATDALARLGTGAIAAFESALSRAPSSPERDHRARYLRDRIDPLALELLIVEIEPSLPEPRVVGLATYAGSDPSASVSVEAGIEGTGSTVYRFDWVPTSERTFEVTIEPGNTGYLGLSQRFLGTGTLLGLYDERIESRYLRGRTVIDREARETATFVWARLARRSERDEQGEMRPIEDGAALSALRRAARARAAEGDFKSRSEALEMLVLLAPSESEPIFRAALDDPRTTLVAALGLARSGVADGLAALEESFESRDVAFAFASKRQRFRAAELLAKSSKGAAIPYLLDTFGEADTLEMRPILGALVDLADRITASPHRDRFLELALGANTLRKLSWRDPEVEHFLFTALARLEPGRAHDVRIAEAFRNSIAAIASGEFVLDRPSLDTLAQLWSRAGRALGSGDHGSTEAGMELVAVLIDRDRHVGERDPDRVRELATYLVGLELARPLPPDIFDALLGFLFDERGPEQVPRNPSTITGAVVALSGKLRFASGQLGRWVEALATWSARHPILQFEENSKRAIAIELDRLSGLTVARRFLADSSAHRAWIDWSRDPAQTAVRERELSQLAERGDEGKVVLWQFVLAIDPKTKATTELDRPEIQVLDGSRAILSVGTTDTHRDSWGGEWRYRLDPEDTVANVIAWRWNDRVRVVADTPVFLSPPDQRVMVEIYETSSLLPRGRYIRRLHDVEYGTLIHVVPFDPTSTPLSDDDASAGAAKEPESLWREYISTRLSRPSELTDSHQWFLTAKKLRLPELRQGLIDLLERDPAATRKAQILAELSAQGEPTVDERVRAFLAEGSSIATRLQAARLLAQSGIQAGARACLDLMTANPQELRAQTRSVLAAFDSYLRSAPEDENTRTRLLGWIDSLLANDEHSVVLPYISRFSGGEDFGYREALRLTGAAREAALREASTRARSWLRSTRERSDL